ncbi:MAG: hypothetical protein M1587_09115 [Thaumarchaeota archaeon]|nr:hypothetical protein [Nitrososphaerota archaeon]MDG6907131.1 hypothetical protein [Nitrososphaerota archaeon]
MTRKSAWYALEGRGALIDVVNLLHPPYTLWHLSYVMIGIALSPAIHPWRSAAVLIAFLLGLGIGAHALDETMGNPLRTRLSKKALYAIGFTAISIAVAIGLYYAIELSLLLLPFVVVEAFLAVAYNLEVMNRRFHSMLVFVLSWGVLPLLTAYFVNSLTLNLPVLAAAACAALLTYVQRTLSTHARRFRRAKADIQSIKYSDGDSISITTDEIISSSERSLKALTILIFVLAIALILFRAS